MRATIEMLFLTAALVTSVGVGVAWSDKMKHRVASSIAILAGLTPWLVFLGWRSSSGPLLLCGMVASGPLFILSAIVSAIEAHQSYSQRVFGLLVAGIGAGLFFGCATWDLLAQMP